MITKSQVSAIKGMTSAWLIEKFGVFPIWDKDFYSHPAWKVSFLDNGHIRVGCSGKLGNKMILAGFCISKRGRIYQSL